MTDAGRYRIEEQRALDLGLTARLVEAAAAADPSLAPAVADASARATVWLRNPKPLFATVAAVTDPDSLRRVIGYAAVNTATGSPEVSRLILDPDLPADVDPETLAADLSLFALRGARAVIEAAAERRSAHDERTDPIPAPELTSEPSRIAKSNPRPKASDVLTEPLPVTYLPERPAPSALRESAVPGTVAVVLTGLGIVAVYAVSIGVGGPFGFLDRDPSGLPVASATSAPADPATDPDALPAPSLSPVAATPAGVEPTSGPTPDLEPTSAPTSEPSSVPEPTGPPAEVGPASSLLDPVVRIAADALDSVTGNRTVVLTDPIRTLTDDLTDLLDEPLDLSR